MYYIYMYKGSAKTSNDGFFQSVVITVKVSHMIDGQGSDYKKIKFIFIFNIL